MQSLAPRVHQQRVLFLAMMESIRNKVMVHFLLTRSMLTLNFTQFIPGSTYLYLLNIQSNIDNAHFNNIILHLCFHRSKGHACVCSSKQRFFPAGTIAHNWFQFISKKEANGEH